MGAIQRNEYRFEPEYSVTYQKGAIHVYKGSEFLEEVTFSFDGKYSELEKIENIVDKYCQKHNIQ
ncbi:YbxH family protein [Aquibacillus albus]|uniref:YbxH family protein n=1 Tax=Aquibacillus albus TaxID=1168171 RepID=A0ABS2MV16_9BACI|nr:YbxH family protein [Aquibacillus albus]MBM7569739.1 hypothetical protein [Aquibacillus albus]